MDSLMPDLDGTPCAVTDCFAVADVVATQTVTVPPELGYPDDLATVILDVPLCADDAHRLRSGVTSCDFQSSL